MPDKAETGGWRRLLFGLVIPLLLEAVAAFLIINTKSGAYAEGFAYIPVLVILIIALPVTLFGNVIIILKHASNNESYLFRGLILPTFFIVVILIYHTGFWDKVIYPLLPRHVEKIQSASGKRSDDNTIESYFIVHDYKGSVDDIKEIEDFAMEHFGVMSRECPDCVKMNVRFYFVPQELYDPLNDSLSKKRAVVVFRHRSTDERTTMEKIER